jgi:ABC-2 type transport system ATP-binding protein
MRQNGTILYDYQFHMKRYSFMSAYVRTTTPVSSVEHSTDEAIVVDTFSKTYGTTRVVDTLSFSVHSGEIFALLGPNGAGKTTTVETLEGYRAPDGGTVRVLGLDPVAQAQKLKPRLGVMLQQDGLYPALTTREALQLFSGLGLTDAAKTRCRALSGGQKRRLALALALIGNPELVFLDEPTAGMDPQARQMTWEIIRELKQQGVTILLTTHLMDEAERLADRVAIIDHGRLIALDTPGNMTGSQDANVIRFVAPSGLDCAQLASLPTVKKVEEVRAGSYVIETDDVSSLLVALTTWLRDHSIMLSELRVGHGSLEDFFLRLTGSEVRD